MYTSHGYMTAADYQEYRVDYDLDCWRDEFNPECRGHDTEEPGFLDFCARDEACPDVEQEDA